jgi:hypothetical protein
MALKKQSIRKGIVVVVNGKVADKDEIITLSESWEEHQEILFKKMLKQGGKFKIKGVSFLITTPDKILKQDGTKDEGIIKYPGLDQRF